MTNNDVLKKLRVYLIKSGYKDADIVELINSSGNVEVSRTRYNGFKSAEHSEHFRAMKDAELNALLEAMIQTKA